MLRRKLFFVIVLISSLIFSSLSLKTFAFECAFDDTSKAGVCTYLRPSIDTTHTLAIYCCGASQLYDLPFHYKIVWQMGTASVPEFFSQNSLGKYVLTCDVIVDNVDGHDYPIQHPTLDPGLQLCTGGGTDFATGIFQIVDDTVNFANYDGDEDGTVDGFFFIIVYPYGARGCACLGDFSYKTNDTTTTGDTIEVSGQRGIEVWVTSGSSNRGEFIHVCVHESGHQFGLEDLYGC